MDNYISTLTSRLSEVNAVLSGVKTPEDITIKEVYVLVNFLSDFQNTFTLLLSVLRGVNENPGKLSKDNSSLIKELDTFQSMDLTLWKSFDYEALVVTLLKPFKDEWKRLEVKSKEADQILLTTIDSFLSVSRNSKRFNQLSNEVDEIKEKFLKARRKTDEAHELLRKEEMRYAGAYYFHFGIFKLLLSQIRVIADSVESDIEDLRKGDLLTSLSKLYKLLYSQRAMELYQL